MPAVEPTPAARERDYLVIYEEPDDSGLPVDDDALVLDIEQGPGGMMGEIDVQQKLDLQLRNDVNRVGTLGFSLTLLGAVVGLVLMVVFAINFPGNYYDGRAINVGLVRPLLGVAMVSFMLLLVGTITTHYGRRIQARGNLTSVRIVEKAPTRRAGFEE
jgi:hypothetical protein